MEGVKPWEPTGTIWFPQQPRQQDLGWRVRKLIAPYGYEWEQGEYLWRLIVPAGFIHDGASVPRVARSFIPPHPLNRAAPGHDWPYRFQGSGGQLFCLVEGVGSFPPSWLPVEGGDRAWWDYAFYRWLRMDPKGPGASSARLAYLGVRVGGRGSWERRVPQWVAKHPSLEKGDLGEMNLRPA